MAFNHFPAGSADTVNPSNLIIPHREKEAQDAIDLSTLAQLDSLCDLPLATNQCLEWTDDPILTGASTSGLTQQIQAQQQSSSLNWENFQGNQSFDSYGSSPADNPAGWKHLVQQFDQHNLCTSPVSSRSRPTMSRDPSFNLPTQNSQPSGWRNGSKSRRTPRSRRGRLLADMFVIGPEAVFEDSDSNNSWTAADNQETWTSSLRERLLEFRNRKDRLAIITSHLQARQRRKVHSMANLWGLSHMSVGSGKQKRMLICKCEVTKSLSSADPLGGKHWNPSRNNWSPGLLDPRIVLFDGISPTLSIERLGTCLGGYGVAKPSKLTLDLGVLGQDTQFPLATAYAMFETAEDAATALLALDSTRPNWNAVDAEIECDYVRFPPGFIMSDSVFGSFDALPNAIRTGFFRTTQPLDEHHQDVLCSTDSESDYHSGSSFLPRQGLRFARTVSYDSNQPRDSGYLSTGSGRSGARSDHNSETSTSKKRKRVPKIPGGYTCSFPDCARVFDRDGDRRKHEKNHKVERPHVCEKCGKGFLFPKDLRRHMLVHSIHSTSLPSDDEAAADAAEPEPPVVPKQSSSSFSGGSETQRELLTRMQIERWRAEFAHSNPHPSPVPGAASEFVWQ